MDAVYESPSGLESKEDDPMIVDDLNSTVLDLTSFQLHDLDSIELPSSLMELDLTANRLSSLDSRIGELSNLKKLSLRQNLINDAAVESLSRWNALSGLEVFNRSSSSHSIFRKLNQNRRNIASNYNVEIYFYVFFFFCCCCCCC